VGQGPGGRVAATRDQVVLVTGAAGFIGRNLCRALRAAGTTVLGVDDFSAPESLRPHQGSVDRRDVLDLEVRDLAGVTTVVHLAARKSVPASFANRDDIARNVLVDRHLLEIVSRASVARLLVASSCEVYGAQPVREPITEAAGFAPRSPYAVSKVALEHLADVYTRPGAETTALRLFNVYGPDEGLDAVVPRFIAEIRATGELTIEEDGEQRRDFTFIDDAVDMLVQMVGAARPLPRALNVGSGTSHSIRDVARTVLGLAGGGQVRTAPARRNEIADFVACTKLLASVVVHCSRPLAAGVATCWAPDATRTPRAPSVDVRTA
jgi:nucleoside-diphosphate-sugar epimerase